MAVVDKVHNLNTQVEVQVLTQINTPLQVDSWERQEEMCGYMWLFHFGVIISVPASSDQQLCQWSKTVVFRSVVIQTLIRLCFCIIYLDSLAFL